MNKTYYELYSLIDQLSDPLPRLKRIHEIVQQPDFSYKKQEGADLMLALFIRSSYWLDSELFDESYLYTRKNRTLSPMQDVHLKMVDIGVSLLEKGFPLKYDPEKYQAQGVNQLGTYVKAFVEQCYKKHLWMKQKKLYASVHSLQK